MDPVAPGADRIYTFDVPMGSAGTYWYHPHAHQTTTLQVGHGLAAPLIVRSADDPLATLPEVDADDHVACARPETGRWPRRLGVMGGMGGMMMAGARRIAGERAEASRCTR